MDSGFVAVLFACLVACRGEAKHGHEDWGRTTCSGGPLKCGKGTDKECPTYPGILAEFGSGSRCGACGATRFISNTGQSSKQIWFFDEGGVMIGAHQSMPFAGSFCRSEPTNAFDYGLVVQCDALDSAPMCAKSAASP